MTDTITNDQAPEAPASVETPEANVPEAVVTPEPEAPEQEAPTPEAQPATPNPSPAATKQTRPRNAPTYNLVKVTGDLPEEAPSGRGRSSLYFDILSQITQDPGEWYEVAHFQTPNGAQDVRKALTAKDRTVPPGDWEYASRKITNPENPAGSKHSKLFARFLG